MCGAVAQTAEWTRDHLWRVMAAARFDTSDMTDRLHKFVLETTAPGSGSLNADERTTGRLSCSLPRQEFWVERANGLDTVGLPLSSWHESEATSVVRALLDVHDFGFVRWVDAKFRDSHAKEFGRALEDVFAGAREIGRNAGSKALIVIEFDEVCGCVPTSRALCGTLQKSDNTSKSTNQSQSHGLTLNQGRTWNAQFGFSTAVGDTKSTGTSASDSRGTSSSTTRTEGINDPGASFNIGLGGITITRKGTNTSDAKSDSQSRNRQTGTSTSDAKSKTNTASRNESVGGSDGTSVATNSTNGTSDTKGSSTSASTSVTETITVQYPQAMHSVLVQCSNVNRVVRASDPFVLLIFRAVDMSKGQDVFGSSGKTPLAAAAAAFSS
jgi:hypothetical protein